ncbi:hypothetical protein TNCT_134641, partial [Trichonephila clavata]
FFSVFLGSKQPECLEVHHLGDGGTGEKFVQIFVVPDGELKMLGMILVFLLSLAALPSNSSTSAAKYSRQLRDRRELQLRLVQHNFPFGEDGGYDTTGN